MFNKKRNSMLTYGIIGLGRFGFSLAVELAKTGCGIIAVDRDEEKVRNIREYTENAYVVNNLERKTLEDAGIASCDVAIVCIGAHIDTSILTTLNLISMNVPTVIAKASSAEHGVILEKLGAQVVFPERDMGIRLANRLENSRMLDFVQLSECINVTKMHVPVKMIGKTVIESDIRSRFGLNIIAIENKNSVSELVKPDYVFNDGDILYLVGNREGIYKFGDWAETK